DGTRPAHLEDRFGMPVRSGEGLLSCPKMTLVMSENGASRAGATPERTGNIVQPGLAVCQYLLPPDFGHPAKALGYEPGRKAEREVEPENQGAVPLSPPYQPDGEALEVPAVLKNHELVPGDLGKPDSSPTTYPRAGPIDGDGRPDIHAPILWPRWVGRPTILPDWRSGGAANGERRGPSQWSASRQGFAEGLAGAEPLRSSWIT